jgi:HEAT repeat protein
MVLVRQSSKNVDPVYSGKPLSRWLEEYDSSGPTVNHADVDTAVRAIGTNGIPLALDLLQIRDSDLRMRLTRLASRQSFVRIRVVPARTFHGRALVAFARMGPDAETALPSLSRIVSKENYEYVMSAMSWCHEEAFPFLTKELTNNVSEIRCYAVREIGGVNTSAAARALVKSLDDENPRVRRAAVWALEKNRWEPAIAVQALARLVSAEKDKQIKSEAIHVLGDYAADARPAISELDKALADPDARVVEEAAFALRKLGESPFTFILPSSVAQ